MGKIISIPYPRPRQAKNLYEGLNSFQSAVGIDLLVNEPVLRPFPTKITAMTNPTTGGMTNPSMKNSIRASDSKYYMVGSGTISSATNLILFSTSTLAVSPTWTLRHNVAGTPSGALKEYKDGLFMAAGGAFLRYGDLSGSPTISLVDSTSFTVTIASPAVFTATAHGLAVGDAITFYTTGALPTGLTVGTTYYVISAGFTANAFEVSVSSGGSAVNTTGSQSGSHTFGRALTSALDLLLNHKGLGVLFFVHNSGKTVGRFDGSTLLISSLNIQAGEKIVSIKEFGRYVLLGVRSEGSNTDMGEGKSRVLVWDGNDEAIVDQSLIENMGLGSIQVIGSTVVAICTTRPSAGTVVKLRIYQGSPGGLMQLVEWKNWYDAKGPNGLNDHAVDVQDDKVWFAPEFLSGTTDGGIFVYDPAQRSMYRALVPAASTTDDVFTSLRLFGSNMIVTYADSSNTQIINSIGDISATAQMGTFETNAVPLNGGLPAKIKKIYINHNPIPASCGFTVSIKQFGAYPYGSTVPSVPAYQELVVPSGSGGSVGKTQGTANATITEISSPLFVNCRYVQIKIFFDDVTTVTTSGGTAEIVTPILIELAD